MIASNSAGHLKYVGACDQYDEPIATSWSLVTDYSALIMIVQENVNHVQQRYRLSTWKMQDSCGDKFNFLV
jgi:hypothetical protein